jgi:hypothetical protein
MTAPQSPVSERRHLKTPHTKRSIANSFAGDKQDRRDDVEGELVTLSCLCRRVRFLFSRWLLAILAIVVAIPLLI